MTEYRIPARTVLLGFVLDVRFAHRETRVTVDDWAHWLLLTDEAAFDSTRPRLWLVPGDVSELDASAREREGETFRRWHKRAPEGVSELDVTDRAIGHRQGRVLSIGYRSDKWGAPGDFHDYDHDFTEGMPPLLYTDTARVDDARAAVIVGGDMRVTERGID